MIPLGAVLFGILGWLISVGMAIWYLRKTHQMHQEMQAIRRYLQAIYEQMARR